MWRLAVLVLVFASPASAQDLVGHSGPVSALAAQSGKVVSGGFDGRAILWDAPGAAALRVERFHDGNVTAVALVDGGFVSAGQDGRVALWRDGQVQPAWASPHANAPVSALAVGAGQVVAGYFDGRIAWIEMATGAVQSYQGHDGRVSGLAFLANGDLASVGADLRFARWGQGGQLQARGGLPDLPNGMARTADDTLAVVFAEGALRLLSRDGALLPERFLTDRPLVAVAAQGGTVAAAAVDGAVWVLDAPGLERRAEIAGGSGPVWALALEGDVLFTAGAQGVIRAWSARDAAPLGAAAGAVAPEAADDSRGAQVFRACGVCHSLVEGDHSRAGPSLHGVFGRPIARAAGYEFSPALQSMTIVWTPQTVAELFEHGPDAYTPGSRMPDQRVTDPADRAALVEFLARFSP